MTQQNTTEKNPTQHRYNEPRQENRPHKRRRRRNPAAGGSAADGASLQTKADETGQAMPLQARTDKSTAHPAETMQYSALRPETMTNTAVQPDRRQNTEKPRHTVSQTEAEPTVPLAEAAQNAAPRTETVQNAGSQAHTVQDAGSQADTVQDAGSQADTVQDAVQNPAQAAVLQPETPQTPTDQPLESPAAEPETTVAEHIDYQAAYQEIYRDILENLRSFSPSDQVACSITEEHISEYLNNSHTEKVMQFKERREKRFFAALELIAVLTAVVLVIHYLQNNSAILVNILYIIAGLGALFLWKFQPRNDDKPDNSSDKETR